MSDFIQALTSKGGSPQNVTGSDLPNNKRGLDTVTIITDLNGNPNDAEHPIFVAQGSDPDMLPVEGFDTGNLAPQNQTNKIYGPVPAGKRWQVLSGNLWAAVNYRVQFTGASANPLVFGNTALVPTPLSFPNLELTEGQSLTVTYRNMNPALGGATGSIYSVLFIAERSA